MLARLLIGSPETVLVQYTSARVVDDCLAASRKYVWLNDRDLCYGAEAVLYSQALF
jgi:hypothetical protein